MFGCGTGKKEKKREDGETETPTHQTRHRHCLYSATTNDPTSLSSLARLAGLGLAYLLALLTGYVIQYPISQAARLLFFYLILFAFVTGLTGLALLTNSLFHAGPHYVAMLGMDVGGATKEQGTRPRGVPNPPAYCRCAMASKNAAATAVATPGVPSVTTQAFSFSTA